MTPTAKEVGEANGTLLPLPAAKRAALEQFWADTHDHWKPMDKFVSDIAGLFGYTTTPPEAP